MVLELRSDTLTVCVLDPNNPADDAYKGGRYCTGGYIFQVTDSKKGELLTGPSGAIHEAGNAFDVGMGQGLPEAFHANPTWLPSVSYPPGANTLRDPASDDGVVMVIGTGLLDAKGGVKEFCKWEVEKVGETKLVFQTTQAIGAYKLQLRKTVSLIGRTVSSHTGITSLGAQLPLSWFPVRARA
jgi:hypothetical protein